MKTIIVPHQLPQVAVQLYGAGVQFDSALLKGAVVQLHVGAVDGEGKARAVLERITTKFDLTLHFEGGRVLLEAGFDLRTLLDRHAIEAIEEELQNRMEGA